MKEIIIIGGIVIVGAVVYSIFRHKKSLDEQGFEIERAYSDELNGSEVKKWFADKLTDEKYQGILLYPKSENVKKWNLKVSDESDNLLIEAVYDKEKDTVIQYREVTFEMLSENLKSLLDDTDGCLVIDY